MMKRSASGLGLYDDNTDLDNDDDKDDDDKDDSDKDDDDKDDDDYDDDNLSLSERRHNAGRPVLIDHSPVGVSSVEPGHRRRHRTPGRVNLKGKHKV